MSSTTSSAANSASPQSTRTSNSPEGATNGPSPMAALMSVADHLPQPQGSPRNHVNGGPTNAEKLSMSRAARLSPNIIPVLSPVGGKRNVSSSSVNPASQEHSSLSESSTNPTTSVTNTSEAVGGGSAPAGLKCTLCQERLEDTHFVQCPSVTEHKFCFPCSKESIKNQGAGSEVYCPSGKKCPLMGSNVPWAFMQGEIATILGGDDMKIKKERET